MAIPKPRKLEAPKSSVVVVDDPTRFNTGVYDLIRSKLAPMVGGNVGLAVKLTAEFFQPMLPKTVKVEDLTDDMVAKIVARHKGADRGDRLPLDKEAQEQWNKGRWKGLLTVSGLRQRYATELLEDGAEITTEMGDLFTAELKAEQAKIDALINERVDPDALDKKFSCGNPSHRGKNEPFPLQMRYLLSRDEGGQLVRKTHRGGGGEIVAGDLLVLAAGEAKEYNEKEKDPARHISVLTDAEIADGGRRTPFCKECRMAALYEARGSGLMLTFYTWAGATAKLAAANKTAEGQGQTSSLLQAVGRRGYQQPSGGSRKIVRQQGWRRS